METEGRLTHRPTDGDQRRTDQRRDGYPGFDRVPAVIKEVHLAREVQRKVAQPGPGNCSHPTNHRPFVSKPAPARCVLDPSQEDVQEE